MKHFQNIFYNALNIKTSPRIMDASCFSLLKSIRYKLHDSSMVRNQRSAGKTVAVGFAFGVRFALDPPEISKSF